MSQYANIRRRIRLECRDLIELVLLPGLAALLPWRWCFAIYRRLARWRWLYREVTGRALHEARARGMVDDEARWHWMRRLVTLVDHADYYLSRTRGDRWLARYLNVDGAWPPPDDTAIVCNFHWGAGMWGLRSLACAGLHPLPLVAPLNQAAFRGRTVLGWYTRARTAEVGRVLQCSALDASTSLRPVIRALRAGQQVGTSMDVPSDQTVASEPIMLMGMLARIPRALFRLAIDQRAPVTAYTTGFDARTGQRQLRIAQLGVYDDLTALIRDVFRHLDTALTQDPAAWHLWSEAARFFTRAEA
ncbi:MAG: hypothetical protein LBI48_06485 [Burkholderiaceae bacterium]|nr:hypothetical protein [Burkholderiaceae bacterium]